MSTSLRGGRPLAWEERSGLSPEERWQIFPLSDGYSDPPPAVGSELVTVVIPTRSARIVGLPLWLRLQAVAEVIVLANGKAAAAFPGARTIRVQWAGHGATRQAAIAHVQTPYVFFATDDALPMGEPLAWLVQSMEREGWDAICPRQLPWPDAHPITRARLEAWMPHAENPYPLQQIDHVSTLHRTGLLRESPIPSVPIAEDAWWSVGRRLACHPKAFVLHSHRRRTRELYRRERAIHAQLVLLGKRARAPSLGSVAFHGLAHSCRFGLREGIHALAESFGQRHGFFDGQAKAAEAVA
jgi:hypothetical protein